MDIEYLKCITDGITRKTNIKLEVIDYIDEGKRSLKFEFKGIF